MRVAIIHDHLREYGGAERVVEALHELWPEAPLYTSFVDWGNLGNQGDRFKDWDIRTSWVQNNPIVKAFHSPLRFLAPKIWECFDLSGYDVVISSSGWYICRGVKAGRRMTQDQALENRKGLVLKVPLHICYIHHPPRNLYGYATGSDIQKYWPVRAYAHVVNFFMRHYDFDTAQKVDYFVANSKETARRVWKFYRRDSTVIYPPVEISLGQALLKQGLALRKGEYFLSVGRLSWAKRVDLAIEACNELKLPLKVVGTGKEEYHLRSIAGPTIEFVGSVSDEELATLYRGAKALIFTALDEDFGMVPVEAMGHGVPVIALGQGGVLETVVDGKTGILFYEPAVESMIAAIQKFNTVKAKWDTVCRNQASKFTKKIFMRAFRDFVEKRYAENQK